MEAWTEGCESVAKEDKKGEGRQKEEGRLTVWDDVAEILQSFEFSAFCEMNEVV